jgi:predicted RNA methylase
MRGRLTARLLADAQMQDGENVLDIGCGCGDTTIIAARATPGGTLSAPTCPGSRSPKRVGSLPALASLTRGSR